MTTGSAGPAVSASSEGPGVFAKREEIEIHSGYAMRLVEATFEAPGGETFVRDVIYHSGAVGVIPLDTRPSEPEIVFVRDKFALTQGPFKGQISVGFYNQKSVAERRRMEIAELGVNVGIRTRIREEPRFWMDVEFPEGFSELSLLEAVREVEPTANVALGLCNSANHLAERTFPE